ncbi:MAG: hypothetical protein K0R24_1244 [Gammaproteobacteria bacterium]|jgi:hypothetical protein|nr:hypothetical protein [Gammaproteobacteria bacterium]
MPLKFRIETRKIKQPRIVVLRRSYDNGKLTEKSLGSFSAKRGFDHILKRLTPDELYEFENFVKTIEFAKHYFNCAADKLDRFIIKSAPEFKQALLTIGKKAKEYGIDFVPEHEMLLAVMNKAKIIEQQMAILTNGQFKALTKLDIDITHLNPSKSNVKEDQKILTAVIEHASSLEYLANAFNTIASQKYQKAPKFKPYHFEYLVSSSEQKGKQPFPKWYYTVAIDVLCEMGVKPESVISPQLIVEHWLRLNKKESFEKTTAAFHQQFQQLRDNATCQNIIKTAFINDALSAMCEGNQPTPIPSVAAKQWLKRWKDKHPDTTMDDAVKAFNKAFPIIADNSFFITIFNNL